MPTSTATAIRRSVLEQSRRANIGHIGSCLSIADILAVLAERVVRLDGGADRDRFVLSKGHAALAWYCTLHAVGRLSH
jgi:transketolase